MRYMYHQKNFIETGRIYMKQEKGTDSVYESGLSDEGYLDHEPH